MANIRSAEKRNRQAVKRRDRNTAIRSQVKTAVKKLRDAIEKKDPTAAQQALRSATRTIDKASSKGVLHARSASRKISRLAHTVQQIAK